MEIDTNFGRRKSQPVSQNSISDILARAKETLSQKIDITEQKSYYVPLRNRVYFEFLSNHEVGEDSILLHCHIDNPTITIPSDLKDKYPPLYKIVLHGHPVGSGCYASTFCHTLGYLPTGAENPAFIRQFYLKWPKLK